jgi:hypothetical protein
MMNNKNAIFVNVNDVITIPSGGEHPTDVADFRVRYDVIEALKASSVVRVNLLGDAKDLYLWGNEKNAQHRLSVIAYFLWSCTNNAVVPYFSEEGMKAAYAKAADDMEKFGLHTYKSRFNWLTIGKTKLAEEVDNMTMEEFLDECLGSDRDDTSGETAEP